MRKVRCKSIPGVAGLFMLILISLTVSGAFLAQAATVHFANPTAYPSGGGWLYGIAVADLNGDGDLTDLLYQVEC